MQLESAGVPAVLLATDRFAALTAQVATTLGREDLRVVVVPHPLGGTDPAVVEAWADRAVDDLLGALTTG